MSSRPEPGGAVPHQDPERLPSGGTEYEGLPPFYAYWHATDYAQRKHGKGQFIDRTYQLLEHLGADPAADRMLHDGNASLTTCCASE